MPSQLKIELVAETKELFERAQSVVIVDYRGLTVADATDLRNKLREKGAELRVIKNRLAKIAMRDAEQPAADEFLVGPSGFTFSYDDPVAGPKVLSEFAKDNEKLEIKCGLFEGETLDAAGVQTLANLPSRDVLLGRLVGDLKAPTTKFAMALKATANKVAYVLQALVASKEEAA